MCKKKILVMAYTNIQRSPRPTRMINWLRDDYDLTIVGIGPYQIESGQYFEIIRSGKDKASLAKKALQLLARRYSDVSWTAELQIIYERLKDTDFDVIISHDLILLPLAFALKKGAKILFDAREFYPRQFEDRFIWNLLFSRYYTYLCQTYLPLIDKVITPSPGFVPLYRDHFGVDAEVIMSWPVYIPMKPQKTSSENIKIIYHGLCNPSRQIETMIMVMDDMPNAYHLDLILMRDDNSAYFRKIKKMVDQRSNVNILPPLPFNKYIPFSNVYDFGLHMLAPTNLNHRATLPNKIFEYIQACLVVATGPTEEMKKIVKQHDCGIVSSDFNPSSMARAIRDLTIDEIQRYKENSEIAARALCAEKNKEKIAGIISNLTK